MKWPWQKKVETDLERERREVGPNGWTCHVCGRYRPDALIGVYSKESMKYGVVMTINVRYCLDNPECLTGASVKEFFEG